MFALKVHRIEIKLQLCQERQTGKCKDCGKRDHDDTVPLEKIVGRRQGGLSKRLRLVRWIDGLKQRRQECEAAKVENMIPPPDP